MKDLEEAKNIGPSEKVFNESAEILCSMSKVTYQTFENTNDYIEVCLTTMFKIGDYVYPLSK
jgi:hypothetical protein